ncbi:MAG: hypothetical protein HY959_04430 [Ignavibacteriae bacterium]|nr:hypothetical protein [Ignavibacteriota bacterium]
MRTKQVRPEPKEFEYELYISKETDKITGKDFILFDFRTTKIFEYFIYRINVFEKINSEKKEINFRVEGLSAPKISLSNPGYANFQYRLYDFRNTEYDLKLTKPGIEKNNFKLKITKNNIKILKQPSNRFIKIILD